MTRQIKKKIALLDHRWADRLDYTRFGAVPSETVWSKLYAYRSAVAHGDTPDFKDKLKALQSPDDAIAFLLTAVKAVIRQALTEPRLIADLRDC